jgi:hypothetical protein
MGSAPISWLAKIGGTALNSKRGTLIKLTDMLNELNRSAVPVTTVFNADGSITETYTDGYKKETTFDSETQITEKLYYRSSSTAAYKLYATKRITFNADGSIAETFV